MVHPRTKFDEIQQGVLEVSCLRGKNSIFRVSSLTFDLWRWADLIQNLISSYSPQGTPLCQVWWKSTKGFLRYSLQIKNSIFKQSLLTFDLWPWADLAQYLLSSSTPRGAPLCQVWWKSTQGFLRYRVYQAKWAYFDQVYWPLTLGGSRPKSNQFIYSSWCTPVSSLMKIHPGVLEISCLRGENSISFLH